nr:reverse transcriptase domain-containing protein [Tanacetum cinerariifolium]
MSTRSSSSNLVPPYIDPESVIRARRSNLGDPSRLLDFKEINMNPNNVQRPPHAEELCKPTMNGRGGPIAPINIQATDFGLKNRMIQQVQNSCQFHGLPGDDANKHLDKFLSITQIQNSCQFHGLPGDDANKHLDKFLSITQSMKQNAEMASKFLSKYVSPSMVTKLRNGISNFRQLPDESLFEATYTLLQGLTIRVVISTNPKTVYPSTDEILRNFIISTEAKFNSLATLMDPQFHPIFLLLRRWNENQRRYRTRIEKSLQERPQGTLPSNTEPNPRADIKAITTRSGIILDGPSVPPPPLSFKEVERESETIPDQVLPESATCVLPLFIQSSPSSSKIPLSPVSTSSKLPKRNPHQPLIPYPSRLNKEKLQDKSDIQVHKFFQMFKKLHFNISLAEALALMPKYHKMLKDLLSDKEKLLGLVNTSLTENCSAVLLKKIPEKLGDPKKFLIPSGIAEDVFVQVGKLTFLADFVVVDYDTNDSLLEEFVDVLALLDPFLSRNKDDTFDPEADLREIEYLLNRDPFTVFSPTTDIDIIDLILERFTDKHTLVYSSPLGDDDDDLFDLKYDNDEWKKLLSDEDFSVLLFLSQGQRNSGGVKLETRIKTSAS